MVYDHHVEGPNASGNCLVLHGGWVCTYLLLFSSALGPEGSGTAAKRPQRAKRVNLRMRGLNAPKNAHDKLERTQISQTENL